MKLFFNTVDLKRELEPHCLNVLDQFQLPSGRLLCFFDAGDPDYLRQEFGEYYCGFHTPVIGSGTLPPYVTTKCFDYVSGEFAFDNLIYVCGPTCATTIGTVITFAHELQHFVQYGNVFKVWRANALIYNLLRNGPPTPIKAWDIPYERDAMIVSKQVANAVLGAEPVRSHADAQIVAGNDKPKWEFFQTLSPNSRFDLLAETIPWVARYRSKLNGIEQSDVDFSKSEWWR